MKTLDVRAIEPDFDDGMAVFTTACSSISFHCPGVTTMLVVAAAVGIRKGSPTSRSWSRKETRIPSLLSRSRIRATGLPPRERSSTAA